MDLKGKTAIVTGGSRGIGRAIVVRLACAGANIAFTYHSSDNEAVSLTKELSSCPIIAKAFKVDVRDFSQTTRVRDQILEEMGTIDILVNNAGIAKDSTLMLMSPDAWKDVIDVNLTGVFNMTKAVIVHFMKQRRGDIINIASLSGVVGLPGQTNYSASKGGVIAFTKALAKEVAPFQISVNAVAPGFIETDMVKDLKPEVRKKMMKLVFQERFGSPEEVAERIYLLLNEQRGHITGQVIEINGGQEIP
jgi:3-oxoacyl-[acyl-carrier protein] reductase